MRLQYLLAIVYPSLTCLTTMEKTTCKDIATFPELFDGMEQFMDEQASGLKRACLRLTLCAVTGGGVVAYLLKTLT